MVNATRGQRFCPSHQWFARMKREFRDVLCAAFPLFVLLFGVSIVLLVLLVLTFPFVEPGSGAYVTSVLSGGLLLVTLVGSAVVIRVCRRS